MAHEDRMSPIASGRLRRAAPVAGLAARSAGDGILAVLRRRGGADGATATTERYARSAERYAELLGRSKGVLMKAGQMLSFVSLSGAVPDEQRTIYQAALGRLQADAPPMAPDLAAATFEAELGRRTDEVFAEFSPTPLAAASIGQVHAARLLDGRLVAVKIQYPGVEAAIRADLQNTELLATFFSLVRAMVPGLTRMDLRAVAAEVTERITEEIDYVREATNQAAFADAYRGHPFIHVPEVVPELSTRRVLTQDLVEGLRWPDALLVTDQAVRDCWGEVIYRFAIGSLRRLALFNADPHPGNYLFHLDRTVTFVDFGCVKRFEPAQVQAMRDIVGAVLHDDPDRLWRTFVKLDVVDARSGPSPQDLYEWWADSVRMFLAPQPFTMTPEVVASAIQREFSPTGPSARVVRAINPPPEWVFLSRIDSGMMSVLAELHATGYWRAVQAELDEGADPLTPLGVADRAFWDGQPAAGASR